jgi:hypothetical protein
MTCGFSCGKECSFGFEKKANEFKLSELFFIEKENPNED